MSIDTESLRNSTDIAEVIGRYVPLVKAGAEYTGLCPFHPDKHPSFTVSPAKQFYHCFSCLAHGDVISFIQEIEGVDFKAACEKLGAKDFPLPKVSRGTIPAVTPEWTPIIPIPRDAAQLFPHAGHTSQIYNPKRAGTPKEWTEFAPASYECYRTDEGLIAGFVLRIEFEDGGKFTPTVTYCQNSKGERRWAIVPFPKPRPLHGLDELKNHPDKPVLIVEGEKTRAAAAELFKSYLVTCWPGGANGVEHVDWKPLKGRDIIIWPDADEAGIRAVLGYKTGNNGHGTWWHKGIAEFLRPIAKRLRWLDVSGLPSGWDAADALAEGWTPKKTTQWAKERVQDIPEASPVPASTPPKPALTTPAPASNVVPIESARPKPLPQSKSGIWEFLGLKVNSNGMPHKDVANLVQALQAHPDLKGHFWFDEFHGKYFTDWQVPRREWTDDDDIRLTVWLQDNLELHKVSDDLVHKAVTRIGNLNTRNEPKEWILSLEWDGQPRVHFSLSRYFGVKQSEYSEAVSANFWLSMVARLMEPGCKVDNMVVLEAVQGARKSSALNIIGGSWYCEAHESVMSKDFFMALQGKLVVEIGELDSFSRAETTKVKQVITCKSDRYRSPYARATADHPRQNVFVGTTNDDSYLHDSTGARRFWPVRCDAIDIDGLDRDRSQLFAEALQLYREGHTWWETPQADTEAQQEGRRNEDPWEDPVRNFLLGRTEASVTDILESLNIKIGDQKMGDSFRVGHVLRALGWKKHVLKRDGKSKKIWMQTDDRGN